MKHQHKFFSLTLTVILMFTSSMGIAASVNAQTPPEIKIFSPYYSEVYQTLSTGKAVTGSNINSPRKPLAEYEQERLNSLRDAANIEGLIDGFPSYDWVFGCSAVSQAMISAYQDRNGFENLYTGPANGGVAPLTDTDWPKWTDSVNDEYPSNPIVASRIGTDGRSTKGSIEDYWVAENSNAPDPFITGGWTEHAYAEAVGDYMWTSQSNYGNVDGSTTFYTWTNSPDPLSCNEMASENLPDGTLGRRNYYQARGYSVSECYNQKTDNNSGGFTLAKFKQEIDAGRPVLINLTGHSIVGYGYDGNTIYIRDTWSSDPNFRPTMTWGSSYQGMQMESVSIVKAKNNPVTSQFSYLPMIFKVKIPAPQPILNGNFEMGAAYWTEYSSGGYPLIQERVGEQFQPVSGRYIAWLGGAPDEISTISQTFTMVSDYPVLGFYYWTWSEDVCGNDFLRVKINDNTIDTYNLCSTTNTNGWSLYTKSLQNYMDQTIKLTLEATMNGSKNSNAFIDDVWMLAQGHKDILSDFDPTESNFVTQSKQ